ncbi:unnamed protein product [Nippostrongylus brasiliensis]|uniref:Germinal-center associated nuclear protein (inferred by orthology to a human protein) n=1 Tax=Nippostrongylus brasiliensis TaxID=27835 RepID=A0A0N4YFT7_NIPBR|nr:unnamed protein product [Nippostrongylus brasiliensis]
MSLEFKIPESFLKKKNDQEQSEGSESKSAEPSTFPRRQDFPSSRLFGNLTRGGPTFVQNAVRSEGNYFTAQKPRARRFGEWFQGESSKESEHKRPAPADEGRETVNRFKLVRKIEKSPQQQQSRAGPALSGGSGAEDRSRPAPLFPRRTSNSAATAAVKRAAKVARSKRSNSREDLVAPVKQAVSFKFNAPPSTTTSTESVMISSPHSFRAVSYAAESRTATREEAVLLRSLLALIGKQCPTEFDKYQLLEERDKILSKLRDEENKHSGEKARVVTGQCPGMCPEKERSKTYGKNVNDFQEYARSAADQDNPLPHELRSKELLQTSMGYLLQQVLDFAPENDEDLAMWYDFLWSRTRAIRKEITQLMLSDSTAVSLLERCARLHILCAYKLCHLGSDKFDQNMNTENLAKCLQSLRHLYEDLALHGEVLETEAEFRGYDVMLHLHDSNVMRQVLSYRKEVRESKPVRLAIQLASALQNNNYVRYAEQLCQVLSKALLTMMTAYGRHSAFSLDTDYLLRVLVWDDRSDALTSLALYGVHPSDVDSDQDEAKQLLLTNQQDTLSKPASISHVREGHRETQYWIHSTVENVVNEVADKECFTSLRADEAKQLLLTNQEDTLSKPASISHVREGHRETQYWVGSDFKRNNSQGNVVTEVMLDERKTREKEIALMESQRREEAKQRLFHSIADDLLDKVTSVELKKAIQQELRDSIREYVESTAKRIVDDLWRSKLWHAVDKEARAVIKKTFKTDMDEISLGLQHFRERMELLWLRQFWDTWRFRVVESRRKREERRHDWENFQGLSHCKNESLVVGYNHFLSNFLVFSPSNYVKSSAAAPSKDSNPLSPTL